MKAGGRLALYGAGLIVAFGGAFGLAGAVIPDSFVAAWAEGSDVNAHGEGHGGAEQETVEPAMNGVSASAGGFVLSPIQAPTTADKNGVLSFQILDESGEAVTEYTTAHEKDLHLIAVRTDGTGFQHVHPELNASTGTWSVPWIWGAAGTYRVYTDFTPAGEGAESITLTRAVEVAGDFTPVKTETQTTDEVDGYTVSLGGDLTAGASSELTISVERDGQPVTALEPYLGAFGHLVALREGDLAYLHVHAQGEEPQAGDTAGPDIGFSAEAPTADRYLLYLDFQIDGQVHTAEFVIDAKRGDSSQTDNSYSDGR
ncbi:hypothetical protein AA310_01440 [Arthrobacter sp. YC-RL1]|uniref:hypothetical protein n=1 Tax=Micrococcaceae TaxID=1268 RepID=UPI00063D91D5|nr:MULTISPECIES: hypothetical protein [Micrococcaceae]KLI90474.1 hypothetical protein AA310_01440 [Arthrobacter sp. YC-RL1]